MLPTEQLDTWQRFYRAAHENDTLDRRATLLIHLAAAMSMGCYP